MTPPAHRIVIEDPPEASLRLSSLGRVVVRPPGVAARRAVSWRMRRPTAANYHAFVNDVLGRCLRPQRAPAVVAALPHAERRALLLAVIRLRGDERRWQALYGSSLSTDERFYAVMLWSWERERSTLSERMRELVARRERRLRRGRPEETAHWWRLPTVVSPGIAALRASALASVRGSDAFQGSGITKALAGVTGPSAVERLLGPSYVERLARSSGLAGGAVTKPLALQAVESVQKLSALGSVAERYSPPKSFIASEQVQRDLRRHVAYRSKLVAPWSTSASPPLSRPGFASTALATLVKDLHPAVGAPSFSARVRALVRADVGNAALDALGPVVRGQHLHLADELAAVLNRPLFDGRTRMLFEPGGISALIPALRGARFTAPTGFIDVLQPLREFQDALAELGEFFDQWEGDPLWFLLSVFGMRAARRFVGLTREQVEEVLLDALAEVICEGQYVAALRSVVSEAPHLTEHQRSWLDHGLEHAAAGDWVQAVPPLLIGLEGALHGAAVERAAIIERRGGKFMAAEVIVKKLAVDQDYTAFMVSRVYGGPGNAFRHGRADSGERDQALVIVVALAGWVDLVMELNAMRVLAERLWAPLDRAIERLINAPRQLPPAM